MYGEWDARVMVSAMVSGRDCEWVARARTFNASVQPPSLDRLSSIAACTNLRTCHVPDGVFPPFKPG